MSNQLTMYYARHTRARQPHWNALRDRHYSNYKTPSSRQHSHDNLGNVTQSHDQGTRNAAPPPRCTSHRKPSARRRQRIVTSGYKLNSSIDATPALRSEMPPNSLTRIFLYYLQNLRERSVPSYVLEQSFFLSWVWYIFTNLTVLLINSITKTFYKFSRRRKKSVYQL